MPDKNIEIPGVGTIAFPDSMSDADIATASAKIFREKQGAFAIQAEPTSPSLLRQAGEAVENLGLGAVKGVGQSVIGAGRLVQMIPGVTRAVDALYGSPGISEEAMRQAEELVRPQGVAQHLGKGAEQIAELIVPGSKLAQAGEAAATRFAPKLAPIVGETVAKYAPRAAVEAAGQAGMAKIQGGDPRLAAAFGAATPALGAVVEALPQKLKDQAAKQVVQALDPTKERFKAIARRLAPQIMKRGLGGNRAALQEQAATTLAQAGTDLEAVITQHAKQPVGTQPILDVLETAKNAFRTTDAAGTVLEYEPRAIKQLDGLQRIVTALGPDAPVEKLVAIRRAWDKVVSQAGGFEHRAQGAIGVPLKDVSEAWAKREATSAIRDVLEQAVPDLAAANKEWAFWKSLSDVLTQTSQRTQRQGIGLKDLVVGSAGASIGSTLAASLGFGPAGVAATGLGLTAIMAKRVIESPAWRLASAQAKDRLADAIVSNDAGKIAMALARISAVEGSKLATATP